MGKRRIAPIASRLPTISPACGPPSSLSPLNVTTSQPAASLSCGSGSRGSPNWARSTSAPLPRSLASGTPRACAIGASSASSTVRVKPCTA